MNTTNNSYSVKLRDDSVVFLLLKDDTYKILGNKIDNCYVLSDIINDYDTFYEVVDTKPNAKLKTFVKITDNKPNNISVFIVNKENNCLENVFFTSINFLRYSEELNFVKVGNIQLKISINSM